MGKAFGNHMVHISSSVRRHFGGKFGISEPGGGGGRGGRGEGGKAEEEEKERRDLHLGKFDTNAQRRLCGEKRGACAGSVSPGSSCGSSRTSLEVSLVPGRTVSALEQQQRRSAPACTAWRSACTETRCFLHGVWRTESAGGSELHYYFTAVRLRGARRGRERLRRGGAARTVGHHTELRGAFCDFTSQRDSCVSSETWCCCCRWTWRFLP